MPAKDDNEAVPYFFRRTLPIFKRLDDMAGGRGDVNLPQLSPPPLSLIAVDKSPLPPK